MSSKDLDNLQDRLGYRFKNEALLKKALTHSSKGDDVNYERLEFLGDRVVGLVMAHVLFVTFPDESEGGLAKRHSALVHGPMLAEVARKNDLGAFIQFSEGERAAGGAGNENILADVMEAIIGAIYLDAGLDICGDVIKTLWGDAVYTMENPPQDPKTALQEWTQGRGLGLPAYELLSREGPDHAPVFEVQVGIEGYPPAAAEGNSRRTAEKAAAALMLQNLAGKSR